MLLIPLVKIAAFVYTLRLKCYLKKKKRVGFVGFEVAKLSTQNVGVQRQISEAVKDGCISPKFRHLFLL